MKKPLYIIVDVSGSMSEGGKCLIARGVTRSLEQYFRLGYGSTDLKLVAWSNEARVVEWISNKEFPPELLVSEGSANAQALISLLRTEPGGKILLLTDGFWPLEDAKELKRWKKGLPPDTIRIMKIGADANPGPKGNDVFAAENLFAALDSWLKGDAA
jgi:hypothetical protein